MLKKSTKSKPQEKVIMEKKKKKYFPLSEKEPVFLELLSKFDINDILNIFELCTRGDNIELLEAIVEFKKENPEWETKIKEYNRILIEMQDDLIEELISGG
jgi:hypothetical protein